MRIRSTHHVMKSGRAWRPAAEVARCGMPCRAPPLPDLLRQQKLPLDAPLRRHRRRRTSGITAAGQQDDRKPSQSVETPSDSLQQDLATTHSELMQAQQPGDADTSPLNSTPSLRHQSGDGPAGADKDANDANPWGRLTPRAKIITATGAAFVFSNLDKVILSIAIIPMAFELGFSPTISGLVQSSFFWGYILVQLPGGYSVVRYGGRRVLPVGVAVWSLATAALPPAAATSIFMLCVSRSLVGVGEGLAPPATTELIARVIPDQERSGAISKAFSGLHVGSVIALLAGPALIKMLGWRAVFYIFGGAGLVWCVWWEKLQEELYDSGVAEAQKAEIDGPRVEGSSSEGAPVPWRAFIRDQAVLALSYTHFCNNWFHYTMLAWLPTFYIKTQGLDLSAASQLSLLPPVAAFACSNIAGPAADSLISKGWKVATVRKTMQGISTIAPSILLAGVTVNEDYPTLRVLCITIGLGLNAFSLAGLYSNHADLSPKHCSLLLGLTNTAGAMPGIVGVTLTGYILEKTNGDWNLALFFPCIFFFMTGFAVFTAYGSSDRKDFDDPQLNQPFPFEQYLQLWQPKKDKLQ